MASLKQLLSDKPENLIVGEVTARDGELYTVNLRDRTVNIKSSLSDTLAIGTKVFVTNMENQLRIIAKAGIKTREAEVVIFNG